MLATSIEIDPTWCGPPGVANGGIVAGILVEALGGGGAKVVLRRPAPVGAPLHMSPDPAGHNMMLVDEAGEVVAQARPVELDLPVLPPPSLEQIDGAEIGAGYAQHHPYPGCFVCGPNRRPGDGLQLFPHPIHEGLSPRFATRWTPDARLGAEDGRVGERFLWAALDCPSSFAFMAPGRTQLLLGTIRAEIHQRPPAGAELVVTSWAVSSSGRKHVGGSAIFAGRELVGRAEATWIEPRPS